MAKPHALLDPANFWLWLIPALLISVAGGIAADLIDKPHNGPLRFWLASDLIVIVALGLILSKKVRQLMRPPNCVLRFPKEVTRAKALVVFVSKAPGSSSALEAALYHAGDGALQELWMITSEEAADEAKRVGQQLNAKYPNVVVHYPPTCIDDKYSIPEAKAEVEKIRKNCLRKYKSSADIMCDFTGFTKSMSAGMILACAPQQARLQYMHPNRFLPDGRADVTAGSYPVEVEIAYQVEEDEP